MLVEPRPVHGWREHPITITRWRALNRTHGGEVHRIPAGALLLWAERPDIIPGIAETKLTLHGWSPGAFEGNHRLDAKTLHIDALILDFDENLDSVERVIEAYKGFAGFVHSTKKHMARILTRTCGCGGKDTTHEWLAEEVQWICVCGRTHQLGVEDGGKDAVETFGPRCRVVLPYARSVTGEEHRRVWDWANAQAVANGFTIDAAPKDPCRFWYAPAHLPGFPYLTHALEGALFDPDLALVASAPAAASGAPAGTLAALVARSKDFVANQPPVAPSTKIPSAVFKGWFAEIAAAPSPTQGRNTILSSRAFLAFQRVDLGELDEEVCRTELYKAADACATRTNQGNNEDFTELEIRRCIELARESARSKPWKKPDLRLVLSPTDRVFLGFSDLDYSAGFVIQHEPDVRHCEDTWYVWDGKRWKTNKKAARILFQKFAREVTAAVSKIEDEDFAKKAYAKAKEGEGGGRTSSALICAAHEPEIDANQESFDRVKMKLTCENGTIDLTTGKLHPWDRKDFITHLVPTNYNPDAKAPRWERFISEIMLGRPALIDFLHRWVGYCLTGEVKEQCFVLATGDGSNGKGVLCETLQAILGMDVATPQAPNLLIATKGGYDRHPTELKMLERKRVIFVSEVTQSATFDEARVKLLSGGDTISARGMREDFKIVQPTAKLFLRVNHKPAVKDQSTAFWRRVRILPFDATFLGKDMDQELPETLLKEAEGILAWAVRGCLLWQEGKVLPSPPEVSDATAAYRNEQDLYRRFVDDYEASGDRKVVGAGTGALYQAFMIWSTGQGIKAPVTQMALSAELKRLGYAVQKRGGANYWTLKSG